MSASDGHRCRGGKDGAGKDKFIRSDGVVFSGAEAGTVQDDDPDTNAIEAYRSHFATCPAGSQFRRKR